MLGMTHLLLSLMDRLNKTESAIFKLWMLCFQRISFRLFRMLYVLYSPIQLNRIRSCPIHSNPSPFTTTSFYPEPHHSIQFRYISLHSITLRSSICTPSLHLNPFPRARSTQYSTPFQAQITPLRSLYSLHSTPDETVPLRSLFCTTV